MHVNYQAGSGVCSIRGGGEEGLANKWITGWEDPHISSICGHIGLILRSESGWGEPQLY